MIKDEEIGKVYNVKMNGLNFTAHITDDPSKYEFYKALGLDVFEADERTLVIYELERLGIRYRKNSSTETLKLKLQKSFEEE